MLAKMMKLMCCYNQVLGSFFVESDLLLRE